MPRCKDTTRGKQGMFSGCHAGGGMTICTIAMFAPGDADPSCGAGQEDVGHCNMWNRSGGRLRDRMSQELC